MAAEAARAADSPGGAGLHRRLAGLAAAVRFGVWWRHLVPPLVATAYFAALLAPPPPVPFAARLLLFLASVVGIAGFGYFLNDVGDIASDARAGKPNRAAGRSRAARALQLGLWLGAGLAPWTLLAHHPSGLALLALQILLLAAYALPPLRLKERGGAGALADALYGHVVPVAITLAVFLPPTAVAELPRPGALATACAVALLAKGLRNILLHQLGDRARDRSSGSKTLVVRLGPVAALAWINRCLLPAELLALAALLTLLAALPALPAIAPLWIAGLLFALLTATEFSAWKFPFIPKRQLRLKFVWCLNDFWELWLGPALLVALIARSPALWPVALLHLALFPGLPLRLARHLATAATSLRDLARHGVQ